MWRHRFRNADFGLRIAVGDPILIRNPGHPATGFAECRVAEIRSCDRVVTVHRAV
jgi:hypothetical protein